MKKILSALITLSVAMAALTACHDVIFDEVRKEVKLTDAQVSGDINSIVRFTKDGTEFLYADNGNIWYKDVTENPTTQSPYNGNWKKAAEDGMQATHVVRLAADQTTLYALSAKVEPDNDEGEMIPTLKQLYASTDGDTWEAVTIGDSDELGVSTQTFLFCTNAVQAQNRRAFIRVGSTVYQLSGTTATELSASTADVVFLDEDSIASSKSAAYFDGTYYVSSYNALTTNETLDTDATVFYHSASGKLFSLEADADPTNADNWADSGISVSTIYSIAYTSDYLLAGTSDGVEHITHTDGIPTAKVDSPTNASSTLSSYYEIFNVIAVNPALGALKGDLYGTTTFTGSSSSSGASTTNIGLWAYYPGRGNWNRE